MCDWNAAELLGDWRDRARPALEKLGRTRLRAAEDATLATLEVTSAALVASITAWSTGLLELTWRETNGPSAGEPEVEIEQRHGSEHAVAVLDGWLAALLRLGAADEAAAR